MSSIGFFEGFESLQTSQVCALHKKSTPYQSMYEPLRALFIHHREHRAHRVSDSIAFNAIE